MIFKDREEAGEKLAVLLQHHLAAAKHENIVIASLLRGGALVGGPIAHALQAKHIPLPVAKIQSPNSEELAIGAVCFDVTYLEKRIIDQLVGLKKSEIAMQIAQAKNTFSSYVNRFAIEPEFIHQTIENSHLVIVDDGIATGATAKAATLYASLHKPAQITIAAPIIFYGFEAPGTTVISLHSAKNGRSISQFYRFFPQISDVEAAKIFTQPIK